MAVLLGHAGPYPYFYFTGSSVYYPPDTTGIVTGTESWVTPTQRGLTLGCWIKPTAYGSVSTPVMARMGVAGKYSYMMQIGTAGSGVMWISGDGFASGTVDQQWGHTFSLNEWAFICGRWNTSQISIIKNDTFSNGTTAQSEIFGGDLPLIFGNRNAGSYYYKGYMAYPFVCAASLSDELIENIYNKTRTLFGV